VNGEQKNTKDDGVCENVNVGGSETKERVEEKREGEGKGKEGGKGKFSDIILDAKFQADIAILESWTFAFDHSLCIARKAKQNTNQTKPNQNKPNQNKTCSVKLNHVKQDRIDANQFEICYVVHLIPYILPISSISITYPIRTHTSINALSLR